MTNVQMKMPTRYLGLREQMSREVGIREVVGKALVYAGREVQRAMRTGFPVLPCFESRRNRCFRKRGRGSE